MEEAPKRYQINWSAKAGESMKAIFDRISIDSPQGAARVVNGLYERVQQLKTFPNGHSVEPLLLEEEIVYRFIAKWNWKILYTVEEETDTVLIVEVFDSRQDSKKLRV